MWLLYIEFGSVACTFIIRGLSVGYILYIGAHHLLTFYWRFLNLCKPRTCSVTFLCVKTIRHNTFPR
jgi:hypothetical protein